MRKVYMVLLVIVAGLLAVGCSGGQPQAAKNPTDTTPASSTSQSPAPPPVVVARGVYSGTCRDLGHSSNLTDVLKTQKVRWHFTVLDPKHLKIFSASGGYSIRLDRTGRAKFYGSGSVGEGWERAISLVVVHFDPASGVATTITTKDRDTASFGSGATYFDNVSCKLRRS